MLFQHVSLLLTFGIVSPALSVIIALGAIQDATIYVYSIRRYMTHSERCKAIADPAGGLEAASRQIPRNFVPIYLLVMWTSAIFYSFILMDYTWDGTFEILLIWIPCVVLSCALLFSLLPQYRKAIFDARIKLWKSVTQNIKKARHHNMDS